MKRLALVLFMVACCFLLAIACDKDHGSSGGTLPQNTSDSTALLARISGPNATASQYTTFECLSKEAGTSIIARQWQVTGNGAIEGASNQKTVRVKANGSGAFTVKLRVMSDQKVWSRWATKTVAVNLPGFVITLDSLSMGWAMTGSPATGSSATFSMTGTISIYERYWIAFNGDTSELPAQVPVTVSWSGDSADGFMWASSLAIAGSQTLNVPLGGGSVGISGTVLDPASTRPYVVCPSMGVTAGTVTFSAPGVTTLTITVVRP